HINALFEKHYKTASVFTYNGRVSQVKKVFAYLADESAIESNFALNKKPKKNREKMRNDLTIDQFKRIYAIAPLRLQVAMRLTLQTTHVVAE
ncbi:integrase, partial [Vibrio sp. 10N.261.45.A4]